MTFEKVMEVFNKQLNIDKDIEVVNLKHGFLVLIWDVKKECYVMNKTLIRTPQELFDELYKETQIFYETRYRNLQSDTISEKNKSIIKQKLDEFLCMKDEIE